MKRITDDKSHFRQISKKFGKDIVVISVTNIATAVGGLILLPLLTKNLGTRDYGIWSQVNVTINLTLSIAGLGLPYALTRFLAAQRNRDDMRNEFYSVFLLVFVCTLIVSSLFIIFADFIAKIVFDRATLIVKITGIIILVWSLDWLLLSVLRAFRQMKRYAILTVASLYVQVAFISFMLAKGHGLVSVILTVLIIRILLFSILFFVVESQIPLKWPKLDRIGDYLSFGLPTLPGNIAAWLIQASDKYVIAYFFGAHSVGIYSAGYKVGNILFMVAATVNFVLAPNMSKLYDEGKLEEVKILLRYTLKYFLLLSIPFVFGGFILGKRLLEILSTKEIASDGHIIIPLIAISAMLLGSYHVISCSLVLVKKTKLIGIIWIISAVTNIVLNILVVPKIGILGAAITTAITYVLALALTAYFSLAVFRFGINWSFMLKCILASVVMSVVIKGIDQNGKLSIIFIIIIGIVSYLVFLFIVKGFKMSEIRYIGVLFSKTNTH